jgi:protein ImuB
MVLARIEKMVGRGNAGSPRVIDSHNPDAFQMQHFVAAANFGGDYSRKPAKLTRAHSPLMRMFRPPLRASVWFEQNRPIRLHAHDLGIRSGISGEIVMAAGPWRSSGEWWSGQVWNREEWDFQLADVPICRVYHDRLNDAWYMDGIYD